MNPIITEMNKDKTWKAYMQGSPEVHERGGKESIAIAKLLLRLQGVRVFELNGSAVFSVVMWISWVVLSWLIIVTDLEIDTFNGIMWGIFLLLGIFGSAYAARS